MTAVWSVRLGDAFWQNSKFQNEPNWDNSNDFIRFGVGRILRRHLHLAEKDVDGRDPPSLASRATAGEPGHDGGG
jgi:hypothetical protein